VRTDQIRLMRPSQREDRAPPLNAHSPIGDRPMLAPGKVLSSIEHPQPDVEKLIAISVGRLGFRDVLTLIKVVQELNQRVAGPRARRGICGLMNSPAEEGGQRQAMSARSFQNLEIKRLSSGHDKPRGVTIRIPSQAVPVLGARQQDQLAVAVARLTVERELRE